MDPFAGGGTTLVEALSAGRNAIGFDISTLSTFVCEAKTELLSDRAVRELKRWTADLCKCINMHAPGHRFEEYADNGYYRNLDGRNYWRLRKAVEQALASVLSLESKAEETLARCVILKTAQWALDSRKVLPNIAQFRAELGKQANLMLLGAMDFRDNVLSYPGRRPKAICLNRNASGLDKELIFKRIKAPKLILTSPPYPGILCLVPSLAG